MTQTPTKFSLYDRDPYLWIEDAIARLRVRDFQGLDVVHLIEELSILAGRDRAEIESRLGVLLAHLLKRLYVNRDYDYRGWEITIREQRRHLRITLQQSPSLKRFLWKHSIALGKMLWQKYAKTIHNLFFPTSGSLARILIFCSPQNFGSRLTLATTL
jgi:Domain of unknown function DUF29